MLLTVSSKHSGITELHKIDIGMPTSVRAIGQPQEIFAISAFQKLLGEDPQLSRIDEAL
jgi:hypothetical protein